ncbi:MAG: methylamine utilization protein [Rhodoferax sp.]|nr:methylamine utilization protein [Rhodoferax sp.]
MYLRPLLVACFAAGSLSVWAGNVQVQVNGPGGKPLADAVVFLDSPAAKAQARQTVGAEVAQANRQFVPLVSVVTVGSQVLFPNQDTVRHHVYSFSPAKTFELKLYSGKPSNPVLFDKPGVVILGCNIHDNMAAWVLVVETPYFGKTDANGRLTLNAVPAGSYQLRSWHSSFAVGAPVQEQGLQVSNTESSVAITLAGARP